MNHHRVITTWLRYGIKDLYFATCNQGNDFYRYGTFFHIMAAEKHLKAVLLYKNREKYESIELIDAKKEIDNLVRKYSHNFEKMLNEVNAMFRIENPELVVKGKYLGFELESYVKSMYEGYMQTRYPSIETASRHFPGDHPGICHDPLGSSFFTDFTELVCLRCSSYLNLKGISIEGIVNTFLDEHVENSQIQYFRSTYLEKLRGVL